MKIHKIFVKKNFFKRLFSKPQNGYPVYIKCKHYASINLLAISMFQPSNKQLLHFLLYLIYLTYFADALSLSLSLSRSLLYKDVYMYICMPINYNDLRTLFDFLISFILCILHFISCIFLFIFLFPFHFRSLINFVRARLHLRPN